MSNLLSQKEISWAYDKWCLGYTQEQIAEALHCSTKTVHRRLKDKPRIRPILVYDEN